MAYAGMRLGKRAEGQKLLFAISDGLPLAEGYRGELIGRIYGKGFLNISDTERMPAAMAGIIRQYTGK